MPTLALALLAHVSVALADSAPQDKAVAHTLFYEAKALAEAGKWSLVCPKLEESLRLDPRALTLYRLADCYEHIDRTASAWALYLDAAARARAGHEALKEKAALDHAAALEPKLARLTILAPDFPDLVVRRDDVIIGRQQFGLRTPVDPGSHTVTATAPGKAPFRAVVNVTGGGDGQTVTVVMEDAVPSSATLSASPAWSSVEPNSPQVPAPKPPEESSRNAFERSNEWFWAGIITFGVGVALAGSGVALVADPTTRKCPCALPATLIVTGAVATSTGGAIWVAESQAPPKKPVSVSFGLGGIRVSGSF